VKQQKYGSLENFFGDKHMVRRKGIVISLLLIVFAAGCSSNPATTAIKLGAKVVGKVVEDEETQKLAQELNGAPVSAADVKLGNRTDTLQDISSPRQWLIYPVKYDVLGNLRYVVETSGNTVTAVTMVAKSGSELDMPRKLYYEHKVKGKSPRDCEAALGMGAPLLTVRSLNTGQQGQLYDARIDKELSSPQYLVLKYDESKICSEVNLVEVSASSASNPLP
jgi:hypothetical protein